MKGAPRKENTYAGHAVSVGRVERLLFLSAPEALPLSLGRVRGNTKDYQAKPREANLPKPTGPSGQKQTSWADALGEDWAWVNGGLIFLKSDLFLSLISFLKIKPTPLLPVWIVFRTHLFSPAPSSTPAGV